jgi:hypothetical protein
VMSGSLNAEQEIGDRSCVHSAGQAKSGGTLTIPAASPKRQQQDAASHPEPTTA